MSKTTQRLGRSFFGKESCVRFEHNDQGTWLMVGKRAGQGWAWQKAKLNAAELGEILCVLTGRLDKAGFFHTFEKEGVKKETRINVSRAEEGPNVFFRVEDNAKPLSAAEQEVLKALLWRVLFESCEDDWQPEAAT